MEVSRLLPLALAAVRATITRPSKSPEVKELAVRLPVALARGAGHLLSKSLEVKEPVIRLHIAQGPTRDQKVAVSMIYIP